MSHPLATIEGVLQTLTFSRHSRHGYAPLSQHSRSGCLVEFRKTFKVNTVSEWVMCTANIVPAFMLLPHSALIPFTRLSEVVASARRFRNAFISQRANRMSNVEPATAPSTHQPNHDLQGLQAHEPRYQTGETNRRSAGDRNWVFEGA